MLWTQLTEPGVGSAGPSPWAAEPTWALYTCYQGPLLSLAGTALESIASHSMRMDGPGVPLQSPRAQRLKG